MRKIAYIVLVVVVLGLIAIGLSYVHVPAPAAAPQTPTTQAGDTVYSEEQPYYTVEVHYPKQTSLSSEATQIALDTIERSLQQDIVEFKQNVANLTPDIMPSLADRKLSLDAEYKEYTSPQYDSFLYAIYEDTGGAHPNGYFKSFVFNQSGATVTLAQVLSKNPNWLEELSLLVSNDVTAQLKQRLGQDDVTGAVFEEGLAPKAENFENFVIDGDTLLIAIPPYQVAAYAAGAFEVRIPLSNVDH